MVAGLYPGNPLNVAATSHPNFRWKSRSEGPEARTDQHQLISSPPDLPIGGKTRTALLDLNSRVEGLPTHTSSRLWKSHYKTSHQKPWNQEDTSSLLRYTIHTRNRRDSAKQAQNNGPTYIGSLNPPALGNPQQNIFYSMLAESFPWPITIWTKYYCELLRFLTGKLHCPQEAEDMAQEAFVRFLAVDNPATFRQPRAFSYRITRNLVVDWSRKKIVRARENSPLCESRHTRSLARRFSAQRGGGLS